MRSIYLLSAACVIASLCYIIDMIPREIAGYNIWLLLLVAFLFARMARPVMRGLAWLIPLGIVYGILILVIELLT